MKKESANICFSKISNDAIIIVNEIFFGRHGYNERSVYTMIKRDFKKELTDQDDMDDFEFIDYLYNDQEEWCYCLSYMDMNGELFLLK